MNLANDIISSPKTPPGFRNCGLGPDGIRKQPKNSLIALQYQTIGETLMISELISFRVGIPWLPPTAKRRSLLRKFEGSLDEFVRISLVTVSTKTLEQYCDDLDTIQPEEDSTESLFIEKPQIHERYSICVLFFIGLFLCCFCFGTSLGSSLTVSAIFSGVISIPAAALATFSCMEIQRRASFYALLNKELSRRLGQDNPNSKGVLISSLET